MLTLSGGKKNIDAVAGARQTCHGSNHISFLTTMPIVSPFLTSEIEKEGLNPDNAKLLYNFYDAMSKLLGDVWSKMPEVNN